MFSSKNLNENKTFDKNDVKIQQVNDPKKATYVGVDVKKDDLIPNEKLLDDFYYTLENLDNDLTEQPLGGIPYKKEVESMQIGLELLGYHLPKYGVDGKFGPETAMAVKNFLKDLDLNESNESKNLVEYRIPYGCEGKLQPPSEEPTKFTGGPNITIKCNALIVPELQEKILRISSRFKEPFSLVSCYRNSGGARCSQHFVHKAVDVALANRSKENVLRFVQIASEEGIRGIGVYNDKSIHIDVRPNKSIWGPGFSSSGIPSWAKATLTAHMSGELSSGDYDIASIPTYDSDNEKLNMIKFTPEMGEIMVDKLRSKDITALDIKRFMDPTYLQT